MYKDPVTTFFNKLRVLYEEVVTLKYFGIIVSVINNKKRKHIW